MTLRSSTAYAALLAAIIASVLAAETPSPGGPAAAAAQPAGASSAATAGLTPRFKQIRERTAALYQHRNYPPPAPAPLDNPFRPAGPLAAAGPRGAHPAAASASDLATLQQAVAMLRVSGIVEKDGESYLIMNDKAYKIGSVVQVTVEGETIYLRVREIGRNSVTLALHETEITLKFGAPEKR